MCDNLNSGDFRKSRWMSLFTFFFFFGMIKLNTEISMRAHTTCSVIRYISNYCSQICEVGPFEESKDLKLKHMIEHYPHFTLDDN